MRVHADQGDTLDRLCWKYLGRTAGVTEAALEANPGLCQLGAVLPMGTAVDLPDPVAAPASVRPLIQLWD